MGTVQSSLHVASPNCPAGPAEARGSEAPKCAPRGDMTRLPGRSRRPWAAARPPGGLPCGGAQHQRRSAGGSEQEVKALAYAAGLLQPGEVAVAREDVHRRAKDL